MKLKSLFRILSGPRKNAGFTVVELMIVVFIIGILGNLVALQTANILAKTRDNIRKDALRELQRVLEIYKSQVGRYPISPGCGSNPAAPGYCAVWIPNLVPEYIKQLPQDPKSVQLPQCPPNSPSHFVYASDVLGQNYILYSNCASETNDYPINGPFYWSDLPNTAWAVSNDLAFW